MPTRIINIWHLPTFKQIGERMRHNNRQTCARAKSQERLLLPVNDSHLWIVNSMMNKYISNLLSSWSTHDGTCVNDPAHFAYMQIVFTSSSLAVCHAADSCSFHIGLLMLFDTLARVQTSESASIVFLSFFFGVLWLAHRACWHLKLYWTKLWSN